MTDHFHLSAGDWVEQERLVTAELVQGFADLSGDHSPNHVDPEDMSGSVYGRVIAHGALLVAFMSACSTEIVERVPNVRKDATPVSLGYDRIRFIQPVYVGDKLRLRYEVEAVEPDRMRAVSNITITNQTGQPVCVAQHILKWVA